MVDGSLATNIVAITDNSNDNIITMGCAGGSVNAVAGDDTIYAGDGSDTIILSKGNDVINGFDVANNKLRLGSFSLNDISDVEHNSNATTLTIGDNTVQLNGLAKNAVSGFVNSKGKYAGGVIISGRTDAKGNYSLNSSAKGTYEVSDEIKSIYASMTANKVTLIGGASGGTLMGGAGNDKLTGAVGVKDTFYYATGDGKDVIADFTSNEDVVQIDKKNNLTSVSTIKGGLNFNMSDKGSIEVSGLSANNVFIKNDGKLYWFEDIDGDKKGEWVTGTDSTTKSALKTIMKSDDYAIVNVSYSDWSTLSQSVKFGPKSAYGTSKTISDFSSYKTK
ncbi:MAG: hypothetical protein IJK81_10965 [Selenomonadaceae bacterium]|nr:hypothetical protein [Selenomonadaceae bacterium]